MKRPRIGLNMELIDMDQGLKAKACCHLHYIDAIAQGGGVPVIIPPYSDPSLLEGVLDDLDGFCLIGGRDYHPRHYGGHPQPPGDLCHARRDEFDFWLAEMLLKKTQKPVLGICGGHQLINVALGGSLIQDLFTEWSPNQKEKGMVLHADRNREAAEAGNSYRHEIRMEADSKLGKIMGGQVIHVNSFHHQAVQPGGIGKGLVPTAWSPDGVVEAVESTEDRFLLGVQWHPERMLDQQCQRSLFETLVSSTRK